MTINITRSAKSSLTLNNPVMPAAGIFGWGDEYRDLVRIERLGAIVTNPVTYSAWSPATGTRIIPLDAGVQVHTGLPNPGLSKVISIHGNMWSRMPIPVILHLVVASVEEARRCAERIDTEEMIAAIELGVADDIEVRDVARQVKALTDYTEKSVIARLPFGVSLDYAQAVIDAGAGAVTLCAPPRGTARDQGGRLISGRVYSPTLKPLTLRMVGQMARQLDAPVIGAGGIHTPQDARDYLEAGAVAVQVDTVTWVNPNALELIARDLGGLIVTQPTGSLPDEWYPGMDDSERLRHIGESPTPTKDSGQNPRGERRKSG